jgi:glc operon protein GlcG
MHIPTGGAVMQPYIDVRTITLAAARKVVSSAQQFAHVIGVRPAIAVLDRAGELVTFDRLDGVPLLCVELAQDKAHSAIRFGMATHEWWPMIGSDPALVHGLAKLDRLVIFGGGVPLLDGGNTVGAIGVSGGSTDEDRAIAEAGEAAWRQLLAEPHESRQSRERRVDA